MATLTIHSTPDEAAAAAVEGRERFAAQWADDAWLQRRWLDYPREWLDRMAAQRKAADAYAIARECAESRNSDGSIGRAHADDAVRWQRKAAHYSALARGETP